MHDLAVGQDDGDLATDLLDVTVDGAVGDDALVAIHRVHELLACVDAARMSHQHLEQLELYAVRIQTPAPIGRAVPGVVGHNAALGGPAPPLPAAQDGLYPGKDFPGVEGFTEVVAGAGPQPERRVNLLATGVTMTM